MPLAFGWMHLSMLGWLAAVAVPIAIHLWSRPKHREMAWAAMAFLLAAANARSRRLRFEQGLLLAVRTLLVAVVVLAVAEPYLERPALAVSAEGPTHRVLVLDGSFSMDAMENGKTRFDRAKDIARRIVSDSAAGDSFTLVLMSSPPQAVISTPTLERGEVVREIDGLRMPHLPADLPETVGVVRHLVEAARWSNERLGRAEVLFLTDLQRATWAPKHDAATAAEFVRQTEALNELARVSVVEIGGTDADNVAIVRLRSVEAPIIVGRPVRFDVGLKHFGRQSVNGPSVELLVDGRPIEKKGVSLASGAEASVSFVYRFDAPGDHAVEVRSNDDLLEIDNRRFLAVRVRESTRALCIDGRPSGTPFHGAADYLAVALSTRDGTGPSVVSAEVAAESAITDRELREYDCVFLCNVGQFTSAEARVLGDYLRDGGNVVFFLGDQAAADRYNRELGGSLKDGAALRVLPARVGGVKDADSTRLDPLGYRHSILAPFRGQGETALVTTPIFRYFTLTPATNSAATTVLAMGNGDPLVIEEPIGRGRVVLIAFPAEPRTGWTAMPLLASFVPLVQEIVSWCAGGGTRQLNVMAGVPLDVSMNGGANAGTPPTIRTPDDRSQVASAHGPAGAATWRYVDTRQSGFYVVRRGSESSQTFAVNVDTTESDLTTLGHDALQKEIWPGVGLREESVPFEVASKQTAVAASTGLPLRAGLLYAGLVLLLADCLLGWKMGR